MHETMKQTITSVPTTESESMQKDCIMAEQMMLAAAKAGDAARLRMALANGANVNATDGDGATALFYAASMGHTACVKLLLAAASAGSPPWPVCRMRMSVIKKWKLEVKSHK